MPVTGEDVAAFLGQGDDPSFVALASQHAEIVTALARSYTRGRGFDEAGNPNDELAAVIVTATARLVANPEQVDSVVGGVGVRGGFKGWGLAELFVLNRFRVRAR